MTTGRPFDAVIFDMDGVLVDSEPLHFESTARVLADLGVRFTAEENDRFVGWTDAAMFDALVGRHRLRVPARDLVARKIAFMLELVHERLPTMAGVPDVPRRLAATGYRLAVASSAAPALIRAVVDALELSALFVALVSSEEVPRGKPAPDVFLEAARRLAVPAARCLVVEDSRNGLLAAKAAGMACVAIACATTRHHDFSEADWRLGSLTELLAVLLTRRGGP
ncbi:MAG TPA: HAD family phosphatase [Methylomirabilota bacterium]|jgi:HAD superfamily hydrolase (TIGR01509 family)